MSLVAGQRRLPRMRGKALQRADRAFLPGALEVLETPAAPLAGVLIMVICLFFASALAWSWYGRIDIIAVAQGKVQPLGRVKTVNSARTGRVAALLVADGAHVRAGELLLRLDPREALAERLAAAAELEAQAAQVARRSAAIAAFARLAEGMPLAEGPVAIAFPPEISAAIREREARTLAADLASLRAVIDRNAAQLDQKQAERRRLEAAIRTQRELVDVLRERVELRRTLIEKSAGTRSSLIDAQEALAVQATVLAQEEGQTAELAASLTVLEREAAAAIRNAWADHAQKLGEAERQVAVLRQRLARAEADLDQVSITSPATGVVQSSAVTTVGQVVNAGEELMRIVPDGAAGLEFECYLPNQEIGFVRPGQRAVVKLESFPFTRYGTIDAEIVRVAQDAIPEAEASLVEQAAPAGRRPGKRAGADRMQNLVFPVTLRPLGALRDADGNPRPLRPGMALTAEIRTGNRRLIDYLLSPLRQLGSEAMTER